MSTNPGKGLRCFLTRPELTVLMLLTFHPWCPRSPRYFAEVGHVQWKLVWDPPRPLAWTTKSPSFTYIFLPLPDVGTQLHFYCLYPRSFPNKMTNSSLEQSSARPLLGHRRQPEGWRNCVPDAHHQAPSRVTTSTLCTADGPVVTARTPPQECRLPYSLLPVLSRGSLCSTG